MSIHLHPPPGARHLYHGKARASNRGIRESRQELKFGTHQERSASWTSGKSDENGTVRPMGGRLAPHVEMLRSHPLGSSRKNYFMAVWARRAHLLP